MDLSLTNLSPASETLVTLTRKGQVTIPAGIRRLLGLPTEGKIALMVDESSKAIRLQIPRYPTIASLAGAAGTLDRKVEWHEMLNTARAEALASKSTPRKHE